ncbi:DUF998 domain-containing protein [Agromyces laixinhei]|uniref:DUF998 domain-containing protein n=1 Tax=Agromyces laixinhei TaxID=2585717 RepID=UPI0018DD81B7|nr:hypothetical protein [Agromyces laixinhei]
MSADDRRTGRRLWGIDDESFALISGAVAFVIGGAVAAFVFQGRELPIDGRGSMGDFTAISGAVAAAVAFALARTVPRHTDRAEASATDRARYRWFDLVALSLAHGAIALLGWIGIATVMEHSFFGATLYTSPAVVIAAAATALSAYLASLSGMNVSPRQLSIVLAVFLVVGMTTAMLSSTDPLWWQMNLSALGITHDISSLTFNLTVIVSGVLVTTIARLGTATLPSSTTVDRRRQVAARVLFVLLGVFLACVGLFPVDRFFLLHNTVATGMAVAFAMLVLGLPWLIPSMPRAFVILGFVYVGVVIVLAVLFATGVYNLTAIELVSAIVIFSWIILFLRNVEVDRGRRPVETER